MDGMDQRDLDNLIEAVGMLHAHAVHSGDASTVAEAAANELSGWGYQDAPLEVLYMIDNAVQTGYALALRDLRDGDLDDEIRVHRLDDLKDE